MATRQYVSKSGDPSVGGLESGWVWIHEDGKTTNLTYNTSLGGNYDNQVPQLLAYVQTVANVQFTKVDGTADLNFTWYDNWPNDRNYMAGLPEGPTPSEAQLVKPLFVYLNDKVITNRDGLYEGYPAPSDSFSTENFLHEIGHALGLMHPNQSGIYPQDQLGRQYTVMSSPGGRNGTALFGNNDINALITLYGPSQQIKATQSVSASTQTTPSTAPLAPVNFTLLPTGANGGIEGAPSMPADVRQNHANAFLVYSG